MVGEWNKCFGTTKNFRIPNPAQYLEGMALKSRTAWKGAARGRQSTVSLPITGCDSAAAQMWKQRCLVPQACPTTCGPGDCSSPGSSVHGIPSKNSGAGCHFLFQGESSGPWERTCVSRGLLHCRRILYPKDSLHPRSPDVGKIQMKKPSRQAKHINRPALTTLTTDPTASSEGEGRQGPKGRLWNSTVQ